MSPSRPVPPWTCPGARSTGRPDPGPVAPQAMARCVTPGHPVGPKSKFLSAYQITDDELRRIEDRWGQVGQDLTFAVASLSICISFLIALATAAFSELVEVIFIALVIVLVGFAAKGL